MADILDIVASRRSFRRLCVFFAQFSILILAFVFSFIVRFDSEIPPGYVATLYLVLPLLLAIKVSVFWRMGLLSGWWSFVSLPDLVRLGQAVLISSIIFGFCLALVHPDPAVPRSVLLLDGIFCFLLLTGVRVMARWMRENRGAILKEDRLQRRKVLIVGAGAVGQMIAREIRHNPNLNQKVVGYLDNDPERQGQLFQGISVLGSIKNFCRIHTENPFDLAIIVQAAVSPGELRDLVEICKVEKIESKILPAVGDIISGKVSIQHIRDVEIEDLLGRQPVQLEIEQIRRYLTGKRILVTGAGGSIGSEICRQVAGFRPERLALFENAETPLFQIENELRERFNDLAVQPLLCDIRDPARVAAVFTSFRPDVVFHAAAYKHVPLSEINPEEVVRNNVLGTKILADAAHAAGVDNFVMISTDKAVNPTNVMGASKRAAEIYVQNLARTSGTKFVTVRFGNVLGSNGSVVPIFREQIRRGGPVRVTHPEVTRFFMTISEAVQLVLQAGSMGEGGEIFLLDMGEPVRIAHLAEEMIRLSGLRPHEDIEIVFTGLRPGEKLFEELLLDGEDVVPTRHRKIRILNAAGYSSAIVEEQIRRLECALSDMDRTAVERLIREIVPEYRREPEKVTCLPLVPPAAKVQRTVAVGGRLNVGLGK